MGKQIADCVDCGETTMCCIEWKELEAKLAACETAVRELLDDPNTHRINDSMRDKLYSVITTTGAE